MSGNQNLNIIVDEINDPREALARVFLSDANTLFPFVISYESISPVVPRKEDPFRFTGSLADSLGDKLREFRYLASLPWFQSLEDCMDGGRNLDILKKSISDWGSTMGVAGVGQYSIVKNKPLGVIGRLDLEFREPEVEEFEHDITFFGEQVIGPKDDEAGPDYENNSRCRFLGERYVYVGPHRIGKFRFNTYFFQELPENITDVRKLMQRIQENEKLDESIVPQQFQLFLANNGNLQYMPFELKGPDSFELRPHGKVRIDSGRLLYQPGIDSADVDFSSMMYK